MTQETEVAEITRRRKQRSVVIEEFKKYFPPDDDNFFLNEALKVIQAAAIAEGKRLGLEEAAEETGFYIASFPLTGRTDMENTLLRRAIELEKKLQRMAAEQGA